MIQVRGFCNHESFGGTGSAIPPRVNQYRIDTLKRMGANGWRGAHEPVAQDLLEAADSLGFLMWVENREFGQEVDGYLPLEQTLQNIEDMVRRSRNHPSIVLWSLCNEVRRSPHTISIQLYLRISANPLFVWGRAAASSAARRRRCGRERTLGRRSTGERSADRRPSLRCVCPWAAVRCHVSYAPPPHRDSRRSSG